jgi:hypothetical protein
VTSKKMRLDPLGTFHTLLVRLPGVITTYSLPTMLMQKACDGIIVVYVDGLGGVVRQIAP